MKIFKFTYFSHAIRESRRGALNSLGDDDNRVILGNIESEFSFSDLKTPLEFVECSARGVWNYDASEYDADLNGVWKWIQKIV